MSPDELRALADALDKITPVMGLEELHHMEALDRAADYLLACADEKPVAWRVEVRWTDTSRDRGRWRKYADYATEKSALSSQQRFANPGDIESRVRSLYLHPAPVAPQEDRNVWQQIIPEDAPQAEPQCRCRACLALLAEPVVQFTVCPKCGNKRCPKADNHRNACTGSNEPGQVAQAEPVSDPRPCTCHPDDSPPVPCARQYALNECRAVHGEPTEAQIEAWQLLADLVAGLEATHWSSWQTTAHFDSALDAARAALAAKDE